MKLTNSISLRWALPPSSTCHKVEVNLEYGSYQQLANPPSSTTDDRPQLPGGLFIVLDAGEFHQELDVVLQMYPSIQMSSGSRSNKPPGPYQKTVRTEKRLILTFVKCSGHNTPPPHLPMNRHTYLISAAICLRELSKRHMLCLGCMGQAHEEEVRMLLGACLPVLFQGSLLFAPGMVPISASLGPTVAGLPWLLAHCILGLKCQQMFSTLFVCSMLRQECQDLLKSREAKTSYISGLGGPDGQCGFQGKGTPEVVSEHSDARFTLMTKPHKTKDEEMARGVCRTQKLHQSDETYAGMVLQIPSSQALKCDHVTTGVYARTAIITLKMGCKELWGVHLQHESQIPRHQPASSGFWKRALKMRTPGSEKNGTKWANVASLCCPRRPILLFSPSPGIQLSCISCCFFPSLTWPMSTSRLCSLAVLSLQGGGTSPHAHVPVLKTHWSSCVPSLYGQYTFDARKLSSGPSPPQVFCPTHQKRLDEPDDLKLDRGVEVLLMWHTETKAIFNVHSAMKLRYLQALPEDLLELPIGGSSTWDLGKSLVPCLLQRGLLI
ncbi:hypothetical protein L345_12140, partial [Ophiophagus hannah]